MEKLIVALMLIGAVISLVRMFWKQTNGDTGCACQGNCKQCPSDQDSQSCS